MMDNNERKKPVSMAPKPSIDDVVAIIRERFREMTPSFQKIATYVVDHRHELAFASAARVATLAGSSAPTVVRFAEFLGLSGFTELQAIARDGLHAEVDYVAQLERSVETSNPTSLFSTAIRADIANLETMLARLPANEFDQAIRMLDSARTIHLVGLRSTYGLVRHFQVQLSWIGRKINVLTPGIGDLPDQLLDVDSNDVCIAISLQRYIRMTVEIAQEVKAAGAKVIVITDSELSPLTEFADQVLLVPVQFPTFFESKTALLSLMNAMVFGLAVADRPRTLAALRSREQIWGDQKIFLSETFRARLAEDVAALARSIDEPVSPRSTDLKRAAARSRRTKPGERN